MNKENYFQQLYALDVSKHVEKKGKFSYLSWTYAIAELNKIDPEASWEVLRFDGLPYLKTECGFFVEVEVMVRGIKKSQLHPVLDNNNKPIAQPNSFQINTSIQRCLVKAIALHGLGLYIYAGEDLPEQKELTEQECVALIESSNSVEELNYNWSQIPKPLQLKLKSKASERKQQLTQEQAA
ncbi:DUF1071 domain-containing protein [Methylobacter sp. Wu1]|uniref:Sak single strand annealing protein n=1 Tax=Methylobacter sp. Wu1 TaxID=3119359 RepID=UPI002F94649B